MKSFKKTLLLFAALLSGILLGISFEPVNFWYLFTISLVPFFWAINRSNSLIEAGFYGFIVGSVYLGISLFPLTSASVWTGWVDFENIDSNTYLANQKIALLLIWSILSCAGGGISVGLFAMLATLSQRKNVYYRFLLFLPALWVLIVEQFRSLIFWGYDWATLGSLTIDISEISHFASIGGTSLLGMMVVALNGLIYLLLFEKIAKLKTLTIGILTIVCVYLLGSFNLYQKHEKNQEDISVAMIQFTKQNFNESDLSSFKMDKHYYKFVQDIYHQHSDKFDILVLPESIGFGSISLDNTPSKNAPDKNLSTINDWHEGLLPSVSKSDALFIFGADTVSNGLDYNSLLTWNKTGTIYKYHKQELVPFAESYPENLSFLGLTGKSSYSPGRNIGVLKSSRANLGFLICQEVLFSSISLNNVQQGAEILVTVGNDGVFSDPAVARINHRSARLRAIETQRYFIRSMRSGVSSVIQPNGKVRSSLAVNDNGVLFSKVRPISAMSVYSKIHFAIIPLLLGTLVIYLLVCFRKNLY